MLIKRSKKKFHLKKYFGPIVFIIIITLITYTTIASAVLNATLQIAGDADFVPDHTVITNFAYTGACETFVVPKSGIYKLETWGAQGGNPSSGMNGYGGYATGKVTLYQDTTLYVCVGGQGKTGASIETDQILAGGFNGGGNAWGFSDGNNGSGGGATDIRIGANSLYARVIVAGGGGGAVSAGAGTQRGHGGGTSGLTAQTSFGGGCSANGGTQSAGGTGNNCGSGFTPGSTGTSYDSKFGLGGNGRNVGITVNRSGGGGGWYGGGSSFVVGGGGSGFVWITGASVPTGYTLTPYHYLNETQNIDGGSSMPKYDGTGNMTGNAGNGYARITFTKPSLNKIKFYLNGSADIELNIGGTYTESGASLYINGVNNSANVTTTGTVNTSTAGTYIITYTYTYNSIEYKLLRRVYVKAQLASYIKNFSYTGSQQSDSVPYTGWYKVEVWGAEGGNGQDSGSGVGGKGGYTTGIVWLTSGTTLYAYIGQQGIKYSSGNYAPATFNGGGGGGQNYLCSSSAVRGGSGGGASDIRIGGTTYYERLIVAGGGGGGSARSGINGGAGGGTTGTDGGGGTGGGKGGTQTAGGSAGTTGINERDANQKNGGFGTGGYSHVYVAPSTARTAYTGSGGGGGWYGGGAGNNSSTGLITCVDNGNGGAGGGGSSFVWKSGASTPSGYNVSSNYHMGGTSTTSGSRSGNGYATITFLQP